MTGTFRDEFTAHKSIYREEQGAASVLIDFNLWPGDLIHGSEFYTGNIYQQE